jgi:hypothetical protein
MKHALSFFLICVHRRSNQIIAGMSFHSVLRLQRMEEREEEEEEKKTHRMSLLRILLKKGENVMFPFTCPLYG